MGCVSEGFWGSRTVGQVSPGPFPSSWAFSQLRQHRPGRRDGRGGTQCLSYWLARLLKVSIGAVPSGWLLQHWAGCFQVAIGPARTASDSRVSIRLPAFHSASESPSESGHGRLLLRHWAGCFKLAIRPADSSCFKLAIGPATSPSARAGCFAIGPVTSPSEPESSRLLRRRWPRAGPGCFAIKPMVPVCSGLRHTRGRLGSGQGLTVHSSLQ